ncbi:hypothetical protein DFJ58DRAFT_736302 [Suillus subalutaceus]|uniref:uncharacterized protein n=1 Tax=Suillus subalutaceus TaxID=48586 RepID=UPI001B8738E2|nr:uncharacterized protein DFJ58DRAFT_736302 [Suillus subalutaceus]KAG1832610.1 hypothetical protein DFJ58DRAFT_736302 [Suillus subalutaceus]
MACFFRTVDNGIKLSSLVSIPDVTDIPAMNKITSNELDRLVTHEDTPKASQPILGHLLTQIFQSFTIPLPDVSNLKIPFGKILHHNQRINEKFSSTSPDTLVPLYDTEAKTWNWALPVDPPENAFLNAFASCFSRSWSELVAMRFATGTWSAANAQKALPGSAIKRKPDIVLSDDISAKWGNIRISTAIVPSEILLPDGSSTTDHAVTTSSSDSLPNPDVSSGEALESVVSDDSDDSDESSSDSAHDSTEESPSALHDSMDEENSSPPQPTATRSAPLLSLISQIPQTEMTESIYSIRVGEKIYTIKRILFVTRGLVGRGTVCYLVTLDNEDYIIKDHWVLGKDDNVVLNEIKMLELIDNVPGIPRLVDYWVVERSDGEPDITRKYWHKERRSTRGTSRTHEFVRALRDIIKILQTAVEERQILHRDCSLNNAMILDELGK